MKNTPARRSGGWGDDGERAEGAQLHDGVPRDRFPFANVYGWAEVQA